MEDSYTYTEILTPRQVLKRYGDYLNLKQQVNLRNIIYNNLDKHFTLANSVVPSKGIKRIPRKLKKKVKAVCGVHWSGLSNGARMWFYLELVNPEYKSFIIKNICNGKNH